MKQIYVLIITACFFSIEAFSQDPGKTVQTKQGPLTRMKNLIDLTAKTDSLKRLQFRGKQYALIQFDRIPTANDRQLLASQGIKLFDYLPGNAYYAELPQQTNPSSLRQLKGSGVYEMEARYKIAPSVNSFTPASDKFIAVSFFGNIDRITVINTLKENGAKVMQTKI